MCPAWEKKRERARVWLNNRIFHGLVGILNISFCLKRKKNSVVEETKSEGIMSSRL